MSDIISKIGQEISKIGNTSYNSKEEKTIRVMNNPLITIVNDFRVYNSESRFLLKKISRWAHAKEERSKDLEILSDTDEQIRLINYVHSASSPGGFRYTWDAMAVYYVVFDLQDNHLRITARVEPNTIPWVLRCRDWIAESMQDSRILSDDSRAGEFYDSGELQDYMFQRWRSAFFIIIAIHAFVTLAGLSKSLENAITSNLGALFLDGFLLLVIFVGNYQYRDYV